MKIATRNHLAEMALKAFDDRIAATALHCLASCYRSLRQEPQPVTIDKLLAHAPVEDSKAVLAKLREHPLLTWSVHEQVERVTPVSAFVDEWQVVTDKLVRFSTVLQEWSPNLNDTPRQQALRKGVLLFNHHLFFEVHEVLEAQWLQETGQEKLFLQGLIQIAVAFYHLENVNFHGAQMLLQDGIAKLSPYRPVFLGIELQEFLSRLAVCQEEIVRLGERGSPQFFERQPPPLRFLA